MKMLRKIKSFLMAAFVAIVGVLAVPAERIERRWRTNRNAIMQTGAINETSVVSLMVVGLLAAILVPLAIDQFVATNTASWSATTVTIWNNLPVIIAVALILGFVGFFAFRRGSRRGG